jgi:hypothetical protein
MGAVTAEEQRGYLNDETVHGLLRCHMCVYYSIIVALKKACVVIQHVNSQGL